MKIPPSSRLLPGQLGRKRFWVGWVGSCDELGAVDEPYLCGAEVLSKDALMKYANSCLSGGAENNAVCMNLHGAGRTGGCQ